MALVFSWRRTVDFLIVLIVMGFVSDAVAQTRLGLEANAGLVLPASPSARSAIGLEDVQREEGIVRGTPYLADHWNGLGSEVSIALVMGDSVFRYAFDGLPWSHINRVCESPTNASGASLLQPNQEPVVLSNGEIDDAEVEYDCTERTREAFPEGEPPLALHHLTFARRIVLGVQSRPSFFGSLGGGVTLTRYRGGGIAGPMRVGGHVVVGAGLEYPIDRSIVVTTELRYQAYLLGNATGTDAAARRSLAAGRGSWATLFDTGHLVEGVIGVRVYFQ